MRELHNLLYILGEISWSCLQKDVQQLLIFNVSIQFALLSSLKEYLKYFQRDFFGNSFDFFMKQDDVEEQSPDILKLGLLFEAGVDVATLGPQSLTCASSTNCCKSTRDPTPLRKVWRRQLVSR